MQIGCNRCQARYEIPEHQVGRDGVKIKCSRCGHLFLVRKRPHPAASSEPTGEREASFEDFDFTRFDEPSGPTAAAASAQGGAGGRAESADDVGVPSLGELDLGDFKGIDDDFDLGDEAPGRDAVAPRTEEPLQPVRPDELVSVRGREAQVQGLAEDMPRLDIQRGPRRGESVVPSPIDAGDRRRSPLFWIVVAAAVCTGAFTAYNVARQPEEAFSFLKPSQIRALWQRRTIEAEFGKEELKGFYKELPAGRRVFVIQGLVVNRSSAARSLIRVEGHLYGRDGKAVASRTVYCGNILNDRELAGLPMQTIEARLQNQMGEAFNNVDIAPGAKVPFMVVFPSPPDGVEKFSVTVAEAKAGSKS